MSDSFVTLWTAWASLVAQTIKNLPAMRETWLHSQCWGDPLVEEMATHSSILAWRIPWTEEPGRLQSMGLQRIDWATKPTWTEPTRLLCPGDSPGKNTGVGCHFLHQGIFPTEIKPGYPMYPASQEDSYPPEPLGKPSLRISNTCFSLRGSPMTVDTSILWLCTLPSNNLPLDSFEFIQNEWSKISCPANPLE